MEYNGIPTPEINFTNTIHKYSITIVLVLV